MNNAILQSVSKKVGYLRLPQVLELIPVGKSTWYSGIQKGRYPKGVKLSPGTTGWRVEDIEALLDELSNDGGEV